MSEGYGSRYDAKCDRELALFQKKKKFKWFVQAFKDGIPQTPELPLIISGRPAQPLFEEEWVVDKEIILTTENFIDFEGTIPHIKYKDSDGRILEEWTLLNVKTKAYAESYYEDKTWSGALLVYENTTYANHLCDKCHGMGGYWKYTDPLNKCLEGEHWYTCWDCDGKGFK